ncbi:MAG: 2Fe-2S iron-sulfur cluster-binding protein, partial [Fidelibacterota bacterium]
MNSSITLRTEDARFQPAEYFGERMPLIKIDNVELEVKGGTTVLEAADIAGIEIPRYCYHPGLSIVASCRMCLVEVKGMPKLVTSCSTRIYEVREDRKIDGKYDMVVFTDSDKVVKARKGVLEFLLINHPLDCPVCDQAGECYLQDYSYKYGGAHSRFREDKRENPRKELGPEVIYYPNRCILCTRCIRFCSEIVGTQELIIRNRGYYSIIDIYDEKPVANKLSGNVNDLCPVGALVSRDFLHKTRVWNLKATESICPGCGSGCNIYVYTKNGRVYRIKPRFNPEVNNYWICDEGRLGYHAIDDVERLQSPLIKKGDKFESISWEGAYRIIVEKFSRLRKQHGRNVIGGIGSTCASNEENFIFRKLVAEVIGTPDNIGLYPSIYPGDPVIFKSGFRIEPDKVPNRTGALDMLGVSTDSIFDKIKRRKLKALYFLHGCFNSSLPKENREILKKLDFLLVQDVYLSPVAQLA